MPAHQAVNIAAGTANAMNGLDFEYMPTRGGWISFWASTPTTGAQVTLRVATQNYLVDAEPSVEVAADVVDGQRDQLLYREPVGGGRIFVAVATQIANFRIVMEYAPAF